MDMDTLKQMFDMHIRECEGRDTRATANFTEIKNMFKGIWDTMDKNRDDDKTEKAVLADRMRNLEVRGALFFGGLIALSKAFDWIFMLHK